MSLRHTDMAWAFPGIEGGTLLVALAVADRTHQDTDVCWPSVTYLATRTRLSVRQVQRCLRELSEVGFLTAEERKGHSTLYRIVAVTPDTDVTPDMVSPPTSMSPTPDTHVTPPLTPMSPGGDTHVTQNRKRTGKEPKKESDRRRLLPDDFTLTDAMAAKIQLVGCTDPNRAFDAFRNHHTAKGTRSASWPHSWATWVGHHGVYACPCQQATKRVVAAGGVPYLSAEETRAKYARAT